MKKENGKSRPVLVTTAHRGVFVGQTTGALEAEALMLTNCRMVVYWSADSHGVLGIAKRGVTKSCRLSPAVDKISLRSITSVIEASAEAAKSWESEPWG
jgi:hypothetical protein